MKVAKQFATFFKDVRWMIFSYSRLSLYEQCPYRFKKVYVDKEKENVTLPLALGKAVHKAIELRLKGFPKDTSIARGFQEANFHKELSFSEVDKLTRHVKLNRYLGKLEAVEFSFQLPLTNVLTFRGVIDLITTDGEIVDWKTNRKMYDVRDTKQLALYAWAVNEFYAFKKVRGTLSFLRFNEERTTIFTDSDLQAARMWAIGLASEINWALEQLKKQPNLEHVLFPARPSSRCKTCPFSIECYLKRI